MYKKSLKKLPGFLQALEKVCDENEIKKERRKKRLPRKFFCGYTGRHL